MLRGFSRRSLFLTSSIERESYAASEAHRALCFRFVCSLGRIGIVAWSEVNPVTIDAGGKQKESYHSDQ